MGDAGDLNPVCAVLARRYGFEQLWRASLKALGFPATWITELSEALKVQKALEQLESEGDNDMRMNMGGIQNPDDVGNSNIPPKPGIYHVAVEHVDESLEKTDKIMVDLQVLAGTINGQEERTFRIFLPIDEGNKAFANTQKFALVTGLIRPGEDRDVSFSRTRGCQLVVKVVEYSYPEKKNGRETGKMKEGVQADWCAFWPVGHADVRDVPIHKEAWSLAPNNPQNQRAAGPGAGSAPATATPAPQPQGAAASAWDSV